jgi:hypothetical protein
VTVWHSTPVCAPHCWQGGAACCLDRHRTVKGAITQHLEVCPAIMAGWSCVGASMHGAQQVFSCGKCVFSCGKCKMVAVNETD